MGSVIVGGARTPIGKLMGSLRELPATDLGAAAIAGSLSTARQAAEAGIAMTVPALTINRCACPGSTPLRWPTC